VHAEVYDVLVFDSYQSKIKSHTHVPKSLTLVAIFTRGVAPVMQRSEVVNYVSWILRCSVGAIVGLFAELQKLMINCIIN